MDRPETYRAARAQSHFDVSNKRVFVTGASSGIGRSFATELCKAGASVALTARRKSKLLELESELRNEPGEAVAIECDVSSREAVSEAFAIAEDALGPIDVIINNAGIPSTSWALDMPFDEWDKVLGTNLNGPWHVAQEGARRMKAAGVSGSIINVSSILGLGVKKRVSAYAISKAGLEQMTRVLALEWASSTIRVNGLAPGYIESELNSDFFSSDAGKRLIDSIPQKRLGQANDLIGALYLLASDASRFMTGSTIVVDGGHLLSIGGA